MKRVLTVLLFFGIACMSSLIAGPKAQLANPWITESLISLEPIVDADTFYLTIQGPTGEAFEFQFDGLDVPYFQIQDLGKRSEGLYTFELLAKPILSDQANAWMVEQRNAGNDVSISALREQGFIDDAPLSLNGIFRIVEGEFFVPVIGREEVTAVASKRADLTDTKEPTDQSSTPTDMDDPDRAQVIATDLVVQGSACVGFDCVNGETFGFDTIRLKENNLRIHFQDTSNSGSFPTRDWRLVANDTGNGGANYFAIEDSDAGTMPFRVIAGAGNNALYIDAQGDVGLNTSNPIVELHISDGDSPTMRLEQSGASGWTPQTWDVAGNETNFFIRDVTNGSALPFKIRPGADDNRIVLESNNEVKIASGTGNAVIANNGTVNLSDALYTLADGNVGVGIDTPTSPLHVQRSDGTSGILVEDTTTTLGDQDMLTLKRFGGSRIIFNNTAQNEQWKVTAPTNFDAFIITFEGSGQKELELSETGNLTIAANIVAGGTVTGSSDRNIKENFKTINAQDILSKVADIEVTEWNYIADQDETRHIGVMAQDFYAAFGVGLDDKHISMVDMDGIALASIKALNEKLDQKESKIEKLEKQNQEMADKLSRIEAMLQRLEKQQ